LNIWYILWFCKNSIGVWMQKNKNGQNNGTFYKLKPFMVFGTGFEKNGWVMNLWSINYYNIAY